MHPTANGTQATIDRTQSNSSPAPELLAVQQMAGALISWIRPLIAEVVSEVLAQVAVASLDQVLWGWREVCAAAGIARRTLERQERDGSFGPTRVSGRPIRFHRAEVLAWLAAGRPKRADWHWQGNGSGVPGPRARDA